MYSFENIFIRTGTESGLRFVPHSAMACPGSQHFFSHLQAVQTGNKGTFPKGDTDFHTWTLSLLRLAQEALFLSNAPTLVFLLVPKDSGNWVFAYLFVWGGWFWFCVFLRFSHLVTELFAGRLFHCGIFFSPPFYSKTFFCFLFLLPWSGEVHTLTRAQPQPQCTCWLQIQLQPNVPASPSPILTWVHLPAPVQP